MNFSAPAGGRRHRLGLVGMGTIGKRLADAVMRVPEFELCGVAVRRATPSLAPLIARGMPVYAAFDQDSASLEIGCAGEFEQLLSHCDIVLDCTPRGTGADLARCYESAGVRVVYQGGESAATAASTYCYGAGFDEAASASSVRVVSCNTTGLTRLCRGLERAGPVVSVRASLTRSAADPDKSAKGRPNALVASPGESHHGLDIRAFWPELDIRTIASYAPVNCGHLATVFVRMQRPVAAAEVVDALRRTPRIRLVEGTGSLADLRVEGHGSRRNDCHDVIVWEHGIDVTGDEILLSAGIHMESIVIPETLDVLFAMTGLETEFERAMRRSDLVLGHVHALERS